MDHLPITPDAPHDYSVNADMRRAAANLALVIRQCGLSQSELSRRSGLSRQLINAWARQRVSVALSTTVGRLLATVRLKLADLLLDEGALYIKLGKAPPRREASSTAIFPQLARISKDKEATSRFEALVGAFRYRTRLKELPAFVLERTFRFALRNDGDCVATAFDGAFIGDKAFAEGHCFYHQSTFFVLVECAAPPFQPMVYAYHDPGGAKINTLKGVAIAPAWFGLEAGRPLTSLVFMHRVGADGAALPGRDFDPDREFNNFIPADACTALTTY